MDDTLFIERYFSQMEEIIKTISRQDIQRIIEVLFEAWKANKQVFIMGNGGSASTASHFVCDLAKGTIVDGKKRFRVIGLTDNVPLMSAWINDSGFENLFSEQLINLIHPGDVIIGISVHGGSGKDKGGPWSQNLLKAMQLGKDRKCPTIGFSGFDGGAMKSLADICIVVPYNSTPQVESFHVALEHLICNCLAKKIKAFNENTAD